MNILIKFSGILFLSIALSCNSAKTSAAEKETETKTTEAMTTNFQTDGYTSGMVKYQSNSKCTYVLIDEKTQIKYDPINMDEDKFMSFKKDANKVYFKYQSLRRMNRCEDAQPIQILELKLREN